MDDVLYSFSILNTIEASSANKKMKSILNLVITLSIWSQLNVANGESKTKRSPRRLLAHAQTATQATALVTQSVTTGEAACALCQIGGTCCGITAGLCCPVGFVCGCVHKLGAFGEAKRTLGKCTCSGGELNGAGAGLLCVIGGVCAGMPVGYAAGVLSGTGGRVACEYVGCIPKESTSEDPATEARLLPAPVPQQPCTVSVGPPYTFAGNNQAVIIKSEAFQGRGTGLMRVVLNSRTDPVGDFNGQSLSDVSSQWVVKDLETSDDGAIFCRLQSRGCCPKYIRFVEGDGKSGDRMVNRVDVNGANGAWTKLRVHFDRQRGSARFESAQWPGYWLFVDADQGKRLWFAYSPSTELPSIRFRVFEIVDAIAQPGYGAQKRYY